MDEIVITAPAGLFEEVKDRLDDLGTSLSGGQQQRLCIARAIAVKPEVILMDEPCSALDPIATSIIEELITELKESYTIIIVTHSMQQAARVSDKTAFFHLGNLIEEGDTTKIFTNQIYKKLTIILQKVWIRMQHTDKNYENQINLINEKLVKMDQF